MPKTTVMSATSLAHHLRVAADQYDRDAAHAKDVLGGDAAKSLARTFSDQATQARSWADAMERINSLGFAGGGDDIEVGHD